MTITLPFYKYASNGNNFVIIDETDQCRIDESVKADLARRICQPATGIGCDTLIFIQRCNDAIPADYTMRVFEQNGFESDCCGNGLICLGHHLLRTQNRHETRIATEIPSGRATIRTVTHYNDHYFCVTMGAATLPDRSLINLMTTSHQIMNDCVYLLSDLPAIDHCYFTYTGAPHVIILAGQREAFNGLFAHDGDNHHPVLENIGLKLNKLPNIFPQGVNVNVAQQLDDGRIAYRCFERGVYGETFACGTGATAVATLFHALDKQSSSQVKLLPWRARLTPFYQDAEIAIEKQHDNYTLTSAAYLLGQGDYFFIQKK